MIVISYFTRGDGQYLLESRRFRMECERLGLRHRIEELPCTGSYLKNCCLKPAFIRDCLRDERGPVLWVDVDGSILGPPSFFSDADPYDMQAKRMGPNRKRTWHVGTMWWNHTPDALAFLDRWVDNTGDMTDESSLEWTWREGLPLRTRDIPQSYFHIENPAGAVIMHRLSRGASKRREMPLAVDYESRVL